MLKKVAFLVCVFLLPASMTFAAPYASGNLGLVYVNDADVEDSTGSGEFSFDLGYGLFGAFGSEFMPGVRGEIELGYRANDIDEFSVDGVGSGSVDGDVSSLSLMANVFKDFELAGSISPFIGGGIGFANVEGDIDNFGSEDDTVFAYQVALGAAFPLNQTLSLDAQYRFFATSDPEFDGLEAEYMTQNFLVGLRAEF